MTTNKVSSESSFYFQLIHVNNIWNIKTVFMQYGYRLQWYGIFPLFLIQYLAQLGLLIKTTILQSGLFFVIYLMSSFAYTTPLPPPRPKTPFTYVMYLYSDI